MFVGVTNKGLIFSSRKLFLHSLWDVPTSVLCWFLTILPQQVSTDSLETQLPWIGLSVPSNVSAIYACDIKGLSIEMYPGQWIFLCS